VADERKTADSLLSEDPVSQTRLKSFALHCDVPSDRRIPIWKHLLGEEMKAFYCTSFVNEEVLP